MLVSKFPQIDLNWGPVIHYQLNSLFFVKYLQCPLLDYFFFQLTYLYSYVVACLLNQIAKQNREIKDMLWIMMSTYKVFHGICKLVYFAFYFSLYIIRFI